MAEELSFVVGSSSSRSPAELWSALRTGAASGWPMLRECRRVERGAPVMFDIPQPDGSAVRCAGRIVGLEENRSLTIAQETPWVGRVKLVLHPEESGTRLSVLVTVEQAGVEWLADRGSSGALRSSGIAHIDVRIGLLVSLSGAAGLMGRSIVNGAAMAIEDVNADGAFGRRTARLFVEDDRTSPERALSAYRRLVEEHACDVVIASISSAAMQTVRPYAVATGRLVLNTAMAERRTGPRRNFIDLGESPLEQLRRAIPETMTAAGASNWYLVGNDYVWPRTVSAVARRLITQHGGRISGTAFAPIGSSGFDRILDDIGAGDGDLILSSFIGEDAIRFERTFHAQGLRSSFRTLATNFDQAQLDHLGTGVAAGILVSNDHAGLIGLGSDLGIRYRRRFGLTSAPLTSLAVNAYNGIRLYAQAAAAARTLDPSMIGRRIRAGGVGTETARRRATGRFAAASLAEVTSHGIRPVA
jgi:branched-chain amino acid transport system substrate-binding protein